MQCPAAKVTFKLHAANIHYICLYTVTFAAAAAGYQWLEKGPCHVVVVVFDNNNLPCCLTKFQLLASWARTREFTSHDAFSVDSSSLVAFCFCYNCSSANKCRHLPPFIYLHWIYTFRRLGVPPTFINSKTTASYGSSDRTDPGSIQPSVREGAGDCDNWISQGAGAHEGENG